MEMPPAVESIILASRTEAEGLEKSLYLNTSSSPGMTYNESLKSFSERGIVRTNEIADMARACVACNKAVSKIILYANLQMARLYFFPRLVLHHRGEKILACIAAEHTACSNAY